MILRTQAMLKRAAAFALIVAGIGAQGIAPALAAGDEIVVPVHRSELISVSSDISEVIVANPDVADVFVHGKRKVSVVGKAIGSTSLRILDDNSNVLRTLSVRVGYDLPAIRQTLYDLFPYEDISVQTVNNNLALTGMVSSTSVAAKAVRIANEFLLPIDTQRPRGSGFSGAADISSPGADTGVINMLKITNGQQVMLRVRVGEMQRSAMKQLGFNWDAFNAGDFAASSGLLLGTAGALTPPTIGGGSAFGTVGATMNAGGATISAMIDALESNGLFKLLAEPNLVAMSGEEAEFLAGGEYPIPVQGGDERISIQFKEYGVAVKFLPTVLSDSRIRIAVSPEISELDAVNGVALGGGSDVVIPALTTRRARTTVELAPGESFMIAGLMRDTSTGTVDQVPGLGEVPVFGSLFRRTSFTRNESELVIAVTPYLVDPLTGDEVRLPTDGYRPPSMMEQFFYGALGNVTQESLRSSQTPSLEGPIGFMVD